ncbi:autotransporter outer membrane beta-barrel domain-containing protein [Neisseria sp. Ec49-e6-T10]|uniref:autotransporter outer membrane beta-barrel domain-containing protein n=1 Tax=Neisseria sp. Ec49-e6-T10 TaxID=3140744 RepID=UPI003EB990F9
MNKVYRVVFSQLTGGWVVTSELAKGRKKSSRTMEKITALAATAGLMLGSTVVLAECVATGTDKLNCSGTDNFAVGSQSFPVNGTSTVVTANNWNLNGGHLYVNAQSGSVEFNGDNVTVNGTSTVNGLIHLATVDANDTSISIRNSVIKTVTNPIKESSGLVTHATGSGNAKIEVTGNVRIEVDGNGLHALATKGKNALITMTGGNNLIKVTGSRSGIDATANNGQASVVLSGKNTIETTGDGSNAIASIGKEASVNVDLDTTLITSGSKANGIYAKGNGQNTVIVSDATITTQGEDSAGIRGDQNQAATTGDIIITTGANSKIETNGRQAEGIHAYLGSESEGGIASSGNIIVTAEGNIKTNGDSLAEGIYGAITHSGATGNVDITFKGNTIETTGTAGASGNRGILARQLGSGDITVNHLGQLITTAGAKAYGIEISTGLTGTDGAISASAGKVVVGVTGNIKTQGDEAHGVWVNTKNQVDSVIGQFAGEITTLGNKAHGISVETSSKVSLTNTGLITTNGSASHAINVVSDGDKNINIGNSGAISVNGANSTGIYAVMNTNTSSSGKITINNTGDIITDTGDTPISTYGHGIYAIIDNVGADSGGIDITHTGGTIDTTGYNATAIQAYTTAKTGDINIKVTNAIINAKSGKSDGINVRSGSGATDVNQVSDLDINITTNGGEINVLDGVAGSGETSNGIMAYQYAAAKGDINIINNGTKIKTGLGVDGLGVSAAAMDIRQVGTTATGNINIFNHGELSTAGAGVTTSAIYALNNGSGEINVLNTNQMDTVGQNANGIYAQSAGTGNINIINTGDLFTQGTNAAGIQIRHMGTGDISIQSSGDITTKNSRGMLAGADIGNVLIGATGNITTAQAVATITTNNHGIEAYSGAGKVNVNYNDGVIKVVGKDNTATGGGRNIGIAVWDKDLATLGTEGVINLGSTATVDASEGTAGLLIRNNGKGEINIAQGAQVHGGSLAGVLFTSNGSAATHTLNNDGIVDSINDQVILMTNAVSGNKLIINNYGTLTGYVTSGAEDTVFSNYSSNSFNIRNFADTDGDLIRDTKAVAISNFGGGNDVFKNELTGTVRLAAVTGESTVNTTNEYITSGALSINNAGIVQGQLLNLNTFENRGTIDLTENKQAGDILVIGGGATAGTYGGGLFVSDGGTLKLDTVLNEGDVNSLSDILVIDDSIAGAGGATALEINVISDAGQKTQGEGIKVIETLGTSSANSFKLAKPMVSGLYEYVLGQGSADQNWYLSNMFDKNNPLFNPATGAYLANQTAASALFMHTLYDRQGHANNIAGGSEKKSSVWVRAATSNTKNDSVNGNMKVDTDSNLIHLGGDIGKWQVQEGNLHLGLMGAYGQTESDVRSKKTGTTAKGKVTGYSVGLYSTWFADEAQGKGLYVDSWAQYGWYKNKVSGQGQTTEKEEKYDSNNWAVSLEAGYGMHLATRGNTEIMLTPQVQVTYNNYSADDHQDRNKLKVSGSKADDVITRVGARLYGRAIEGYSAKPFIEANWLHHTAKNELSFNGEVLKDGVPKDRAEAKLGLQGTISKNWKVWGQVGAQWGGDNYTRYEGQAGLNYQW